MLSVVQLNDQLNAVESNGIYKLFKLFIFSVHPIG